MARRRRKTNEERREEFRAGDRKLSDEFYVELAAAKTLSDVSKLLGKMPGPDRTGRGCYRSLSYFFKSEFALSPGTSRSDMKLYIELIQRLKDSGEMSETMRERTEKTLRTAIDGNDPWFE